MQHWSRRGIGIILNTEAFRMEVDCSRARAGSGIEGRVVVSHTEVCSPSPGTNFTVAQLCYAEIMQSDWLKIVICIGTSKQLVLF